MPSTMPVTLVRHIRKAVGTDRSRSDRELLRRFIQFQDAVAFEVLVERHGPMVRGVCQRILGNATDADDAFQASFLVLVRKAGSIRKRASLGPWLYGVAQRISYKTRVRLARQRQCEQEAANMQSARPAEDMTLRDLKSILDDEIAALPEKYRAPLILCCLQGKARDEAAQELGWSEGSLKGRLERGRELLRRRLVRRGLSLTAVPLAMLSLAGLGTAAVPASLVAGTVASGLQFAAGQALTGLASAQALAMATAFLQATSFVRVKWAVLVVMMALGLGGGGTYLSSSSATPGPEQYAGMMAEPAWRPMHAVPAGAAEQKQGNQALDQEPALAEDLPEPEQLPMGKPVAPGPRLKTKNVSPIIKSVTPIIKQAIKIGATIKDKKAKLQKTDDKSKNQKSSFNGFNFNFNANNGKASSIPGFPWPRSAGKHSPHRDDDDDDDDGPRRRGLQKPSFPPPSTTWGPKPKATL